MTRRLSFQHLEPKLRNALAQHVQHRGTASGQVVIATPARTGIRFDLAPQPAVAFHTFQKRVQRPWAEVVAVTTQLRNHPLPDDRMFGGVMEDMHFPEAEKNFTGQQLAIDGRHASPLYGWVLLNASEFVSPTIPFVVAVNAGLDVAERVGVSPIRCAAWRCLIGRRPLEPVDHDEIDRSVLPLQSQSQWFDGARK